MRAGVYRVTRCLAVGGYPDADMTAFLRKIGVTHILNVCASEPAQATARADFSEIVCRPIRDLYRMADDVVLDCLDSAHRMLRTSGSRLYVHCLAGQNRSPNILWLYLIACGMDPAEAKGLIEERTLDAIPGHPAMVDESLVETARLYGRRNFLPLSRPEILQRVE